jgi:hypothetical protein
MQVGQKIVYFPTDGRLSEEYCKENNLIGTTDANGNRIGGYFDDRRKVTTLKLRKMPSDGYAAPIESLSYTGIKLDDLKEGTLIDTLNNHLICEKYISKGTRSALSSRQGKVGKYTFRETVQYLNFHEHIDTQQFAYNKSRFKKGDFLVCSLKIHGTSGRSSYSLETKYTKLDNFINYLWGSLFKTKLLKGRKEYKYIYGTRRVVCKDNKSRTTGFYKENEGFRQLAHENFVNKLNKGETVYYEIAGYVSSDKSIMAEVSNEKLGKDFIKEYGKTTIFDYGCLPGTSDVYVYRMSITNEEGYEVEYTDETMRRRCEEMNVKCVPLLDKFIYDGNEEELTKRVNELSDGPDLIGHHWREGCVVRINDSRWVAFKNKNIIFKILEGISKDNEVLDIEEVQDISMEGETSELS